MQRINHIADLADVRGVVLRVVRRTGAVHQVYDGQSRVGAGVEQFGDLDGAVGRDPAAARRRVGSDYAHRRAVETGKAGDRLFAGASAHLAKGARVERLGEDRAHVALPRYRAVGIVGRRRVGFGQIRQNGRDARFEFRIAADDERVQPGRRQRLGGAHFLRAEAGFGGQNERRRGGRHRLFTADAAVAVRGEIA